LLQAIVKKEEEDDERKGAGLCNAAVTFFPILSCSFLNKTDLHRIFRDGRHVSVDVQSGIAFRIGQGTLPWQPILGAKSAEIGDTPSFLGIAFHKRW